jgi:hypothetical protein
MVLEHDAAVTSVAFCGDAGPAISVTRRGFISVTTFPSQQRCDKEMFTRAITDVRVKREEYEDSTTWLLALASGNTATLVEITKSSRRGPYVVNERDNQKDFLHDEDEELFSAQHMPGDVTVGAAIVTGSRKYIHLWSLEGERMLRLSDAAQTDFRCFHIAQTDEGWGWIAGGAGTFFVFLAITGWHNPSEG